MPGLRYSRGCKEVDFTFVDILVVIVIITIAATIVSATFARTRENTHKMRYLSNLKADCESTDLALSEPTGLTL